MLTYGHTRNHWKGYEGLGWLLTNFGSDNIHIIIDMTWTEEVEVTLLWDIGVPVRTKLRWTQIRYGKNAFILKLVSCCMGGIHRIFFVMLHTELSNVVKYRSNVVANVVVTEDNG